VRASAADRAPIWPYVPPGASSATIRPVRAFVVALIAWSALVVAVLLFYPAGHAALGCMSLVGRFPACEAQQAAINQVWWENETLPGVLGIVAGYVGIVAVALVGARRRASRR
jgi:hypothetical protein